MIGIARIASPDVDAMKNPSTRNISITVRAKIIGLIPSTQPDMVYRRVSETLPLVRSMFTARASPQTSATPTRSEAPLMNTSQIFFSFIPPMIPMMTPLTRKRTAICSNHQSSLTTPITMITKVRKKRTRMNLSFPVIFFACSSLNPKCSSVHAWFS